MVDYVSFCVFRYVRTPDQLIYLLYNTSFVYVHVAWFCWHVVYPLKASTVSNVVIACRCDNSFMCVLMIICISNTNILLHGVGEMLRVISIDLTGVGVPSAIGFVICTQCHKPEQGLARITGCFGCL